MTALANISEAKRLLAATSSLTDVKDIRDKAEAVRKYRQVSGESLEAQNHAAEIRLLAERRAGDLLSSMEKHNGDPRSLDVTRLSDMGISKMQSYRWQKLARVPEKLFATRMEELKAAEKEVTTKEFLKLLVKANTTSTMPNREGVVGSIEELVADGKTFGTIYADPPWRYGNQATRAATDMHYPTMTVEDIAAMPVASVAADNCHLHLWTTNAFLFDAKVVLEAWGFTYKSCFIWVKPQMGIGNYWRVSHEFMLLGVRGSAPFASRDQKSWISADRTEHSAKPEEVRLAIEKVSPSPRLEMFGRAPAEGWVVMGNQIENRLFPK